MHWCVPVRFGALEAAGAVTFAAAALETSDPLAVALTGPAALILLVLAARDLLVRTRLSADSAGITVVSGYAGRRRIPWSQVATVRVDERSRLGLSSRLLEVDTGDTVHLFSGRELGTDPAEVAAVLSAFSR